MEHDLPYRMIMHAQNEAFLTTYLIGSKGGTCGRQRLLISRSWTDMFSHLAVLIAAPFQFIHVISMSRLTQLHSVQHYTVTIICARLVTIDTL